MPRYVGLINWTDEGIKSFKETVDRATQTEQIAEKIGARVTDIYCAVGEHDVVAILEAPDDETATAFLLSIGARGNIRTKTLRAFNREEMQSIIAKTA